MLILPSAMAATSYNLADYITNDEKAVVTNDYEIYGNIDGMSIDDFNAIVNDGENKVYLHYRTDRNIDLPYDAQLCVKAFGKVHSFEFTEQERSDADFLVVAIKSFVNLYKSKIAELQQSRPHKAPAAAADGVPTTFIKCDVEKEYMVRFDKRGYITYHVAAAQYNASEPSQLYIATVRTSFVPGKIARENGDTSYGTYYNKSGYVHMTVEQAYDANEADLYGTRYGGQPYKKDYWPLNDPAVVTVTSSVQAGLTFGRSLKTGFSTEMIGVSVEDTSALNISYAYSKSYTRTDPRLSVQVSSSNANTVQWLYTYAELGGEHEAHHLETNYMFELSNIKNSLLKGDFRLKLDFMFETGVIKKKHTASADLFIGAGARQEIKPFSNGLI